MGQKKRIVLLQGAFDIIHAAHIRAFKFAKSKGDYLIVALNTNELIKKYKGRDAVMPWGQKKFIIESCRYVDKVVAAPDFSPLKLLKEHKVDVYIITREWERTKAAEFAYMKQKGGKVIFSPRSRSISTTAIKEALLKEYLNDTCGKALQRPSDFTNGSGTAGNCGNGKMPPPNIDGRAAGTLREG